MSALVTLLATLCFAYAAGIFTVLSMIEKPIWPLLQDPADEHVRTATVRRIHAQLRELLPLLPPTMKTVMGAGAVLLATQAWLQAFDGITIATLAVFVLGMLYILRRLQPRIRAVAALDSAGDATQLRIATGELAALHRAGLAVAASVLALQIALVATI